MMDWELKRLSRQRLLEELSESVRVNGELQIRLENTEAELNDQIRLLKEELAKERKKAEDLEKKNADLRAGLQSNGISYPEIGNIAEVTAGITGIFAEAQKTADLYLTNVKEVLKEKEKCILEMEAKSLKDVQKMGEEANRTCLAMRMQVEKECRELKDSTEKECTQLRETTEKECTQLRETTGKDCRELRETTEKECAELRESTEKECTELREQTQTECKNLQTDTYIRAEGYWKSLTTRLDNYYKAHQGMRELLGSDGIKLPSFNDINQRKK